MPHDSEPDDLGAMPTEKRQAGRDGFLPVSNDVGLGATVRGFVAGQQLFGRYLLRQILGRGGMGVVWLAHDEQLERDVALKFLPELITLDKEAIADLKRETRRSLELTHPNIVRIYDFVQDSSWAGISMEYVGGETLSAMKVEQPNGCFDVEMLRPWVKQLMDALEYAHERAKVVHRDLKPANLMINQAGELKVADFGIARSVSDSVSRVTMRQGTSGTLTYMSPQQARGGRTTVSDDIYSVGATLYDLIAGKPPFYTGEIYQQLLNEAPVSMAARRVDLDLKGAPIPAEWEETIAACLAKEPEQRPQTIAEVAERLGLRGTIPPSRILPRKVAASSPGGPKKRQPLLIAAAVVAMMVLGGLGYYFGVAAPAEKARQEEIAKQEAIQKQKEAEARAEADAAEKARLEAEAQKAAAAAEALRTQQEKDRQEAERLAAARGGLIVKSEPEGANVTLGGTDAQTSPATFKDEKLGSYPIHISLDGYESVDQTAEIKENQFTDLGTITLAHSKGAIQITTEFAGLDYTIIQNGITVNSGKTPATVPDLPTGSYEVSVRKGDWEINKSILVSRNQTAVCAPEFLLGSATITSTPPGAQVLQGEKMLGITPLTLNEVRVGPISLFLRLKGYKPGRVDKTIAANQRASLELALEKSRIFGFLGKWNMLHDGKGLLHLDKGTVTDRTTYSAWSYTIDEDENENPIVTSSVASVDTACLTGDPNGNVPIPETRTVPGEHNVGNSSNYGYYRGKTTVVSCQYLESLNVIEWTTSEVCTIENDPAVTTVAYFALDSTQKKLSVLTKAQLSDVHDGSYSPSSELIETPERFGLSEKYTVSSYATKQP